MREQPNHAVAPTPAPKMDWAPVRLVMDGFLSNLGWNAILLLLVMWILKVLLGIMTASMGLPPGMVGFDVFCSLCISFVGLIAIDAHSRDRVLWPILPLGPEHKSMIRWLQLVFLPWLTIMALMGTSLAVMLLLCPSKNIFPYYFLGRDMLTAGLFPFLVMAFFGAMWLAHGKSPFTLFLMQLLFIVLAFYLIHSLMHLYTWMAHAPSAMVTLLIFAANLSVLFASYKMKLLMVRNIQISIHPNADAVPAKVPAKPMPKRALWIILLSEYKWPALFAFFLFNDFIEDVCKDGTTEGRAIVLLVIIIVVTIFIPKRVHPVNARELRMLPLRRWQLAWISSWEASMQMLLLLSSVVVPCYLIAYHWDRQLPPWGTNIFTWLLFVSGLAMMIRPLVCLVAKSQPRNYVLYISNLLEYLLALFAAIVMGDAVLPVRFAPFLSSLLNQSSVPFMLYSLLFFIASLAAGHFLSQRTWNNTNLYRCPVEARI